MISFNNLARTLDCWNLNTDPNWFRKAGIWPHQSLSLEETKAVAAGTTQLSWTRSASNKECRAAWLHSTGGEEIYQARMECDRPNVCPITFTFHTLSIVYPMCETFKVILLMSAPRLGRCRPAHTEGHFVCFFFFTNVATASSRSIGFASYVLCNHQSEHCFWSVILDDNQKRRRHCFTSSIEQSLRMPQCSPAVHCSRVTVASNISGSQRISLLLLWRESHFLEDKGGITGGVLW